MKNYKQLFWDLDHTLWDFEANSKATLAVLYDDFKLWQLGIDDFDDFATKYEIHNDYLWSKLRKGEVTRTYLRWKRMDLALKEYAIDNEAVAIQLSERYLEILPKQKILMPGARDTLEYCKAKHYKMSIITNGFETTQWEKLRNSEIHHFFDEMITSEKANAMKPNPPIFEYALQKTHASKQDSLMIGDCLDADMGGAKKFGIDQLFFNPSKKQHQEEWTYEVNILEEIKTIL